MQGVAIVLLLVLFVVRGPSALRRRAARPAWFASGFALIGLLTLNVFIPLDTIDRLLGGMNLWNLLEALAATAAFWFFYRAVQAIQGQRATPTGTVGFVALLAALAITFLMIPTRGTTQVQFVANHLRFWQTWLYLLIYLVGLVVISAMSAWTVRRRWRGVFAAFLAGYALVGLGCISDVLYISVAHFGTGAPKTYKVYQQVFDLFFYFGVFLLAIGFLTFYTGRLVRRSTLVWRVRAARLTSIRLRMDGQQRAMRWALRSLVVGEPVARTYDELVRIRDLVYLGHVESTPSEAVTVARAEAALERHNSLSTLMQLAH